MKALELLRHLKFSITSAVSGKFQEIKAKDSLGKDLVLSYMGDAPMAGMPVTIITPEGELPAPSGEYTDTATNNILKVTDGVIMEIAPSVVTEEQKKTDPAATATPKTNEMTEAQVKSVIESTIKEMRYAEQIETLTKENAELKASFAAQAKEKEAQEKKAAEDKKALTDKIDLMFKAIEELGEKPSEESKQKKKDGFKAAASSPDEMRKAVLEFRQKNNLPL